MAASLRERIAIHESAHAVAALTFGIPIVAVHIGDQPHMHRGRYRAPPDLGREAMLTLCFAGAEAEKIYCGPVTDSSDAGDLHMAREIAARSIPNPLQAAAELARCRDAAQRLVRSAWAQQRIAVLAAALLRNGSLSAEEIYAVAAAPPLAHRPTMA